MITERKYWEDCYVKEFEAKIREVGANYIVLDRTYFYPQGGGQPGDTGTIDDVNIIDTKKDDDKIYHYFEGDCNLNDNDIVHCQLDWERRYSLMRTHSASHLVEYFLFQTVGEIESEGSFISEKKDKSTYVTDINFTPDILKEVADKTNEFIDKDHEIVLLTSNDDPSVRYWICENIKYNCGGTHPHRTSEIGHVTVKRKTGGKGKQKIVTEIE